MVDPNRLLEFFERHSDKLHIAGTLDAGADRDRSDESERGATLNADVAIEAPTADEPVEPSAGVAHELLSFADWKLVNEVGLDAVSDIKRRHALLQPVIA